MPLFEFVTALFAKDVVETYEDDEPDVPPRAPTVLGFLQEARWNPTTDPMVRTWFLPSTPPLFVLSP